MKSGTKGKQGFQRDYNPFKILTVLLKTREKKVMVIKKELCKLDKLYCIPTKKWYNESLQKLESMNLVKRIEKEMDPAYYWVITEEGIRKLDEINKEEVD
jgi:DNA-binding HxlR family transcriptional regulator